MRLNKKKFKKSSKDKTKLVKWKCSKCSNTHNLTKKEDSETIKMWCDEKGCGKLMYRVN